MASKAYVASMTVAELTSELKKRGLNWRGKKKALQNRLEQALYEEENSETSSESNEEATIRAASAVISQLEGNCEPESTHSSLIVSIEHSRRVLSELPAASEEGKSNGSHGATQQVEVEPAAPEPPGENSVQELVNENSVSVPEVPEPMDVNSKPVPEPVQEENVSVPVKVNEEETLPETLPDLSSLKPTNENLEPVPDPVLEPVPDPVLEPVPDPVLEPVPDPVLEPVPDPVLREPEPTATDFQPAPPEPVVANENLEPVPDPAGSSREPEPMEESLEPLAAAAQEPLEESSTLKESIAIEIVSEYTSVIVENREREKVTARESITPEKSLESNPSKEGIFLSPPDKDLESESEVNSIAVEPPSPLRDEISFAIEDASQSTEEAGETPSDVATATNVSAATVDNDEPMETSDVVAASVADSEMSKVISTTSLRGGDGKVQSNSDSSVLLIKDEVMNVSSSTAVVDSSEIDIVVPLTAEEDDLVVFSTEADNRQQKREESGKLKEKNMTLSDPVVTGGRNDTERNNDSIGVVSKEESTRKRQVSLNDRPGESKDSDASSKRRRISTSPKRLQERRRRWGSSTSHTPTASQPPISSDTLETIIPEEVKEEVTENLLTNMEVMEEMKQDEDDIVELGKDTSLMDEYEREWQEKEREKELQKKEIGRARREMETSKHEIKYPSFSDDKEIRKQRTPTPPTNPPTRILHIENLKRPFTLVQLKELLQEDGPLIDGGFWTNKIKSHCIAIFTSTDTAISTRKRLHGLKWPSINPHYLRVDFLTNRKVSEVSEGQLIIDSRSPTPTDTPTDTVKQTKPPKEEKPLKQSPPPHAKVNEIKTENTTAEPEANKEEKATRVLDDLFRKTKAAPPIYWLPLSETEVAQKVAEQKAREEEREKRRQQRQKEMEAMEQERKERERKLREERERERKSSPRRRNSRRSQSRSRSPRRRR